MESRYNTLELRLPQDTYAEQLEVINEINFTRREIDIIACILSGKSAKHIASFLSISPKTVENHIRNVMLKTGCKTQPAVIDLVEKSHQFPLIKNHYSSLLVQYSFTSELKNISKIVTKKLNCFILYNKALKNVAQFFSYFVNDLQIAGINTFVENTKKNEFGLYLPDNVKHSTINTILYHLEPEQVENLDLKEITQFTQQHSCRFIFIMIAKSSAKMAPQKLSNFETIVLQELKDYYFFIFEVLKKLLSPLEVQENISTFEQQYKIFSESGSTHIKQEEIKAPIIHDAKNMPLNVSNKQNILLVSLGIICLILLGVILSNKPLNQAAHLKEINVKGIQNVTTMVWNLPRQDHIFIGRKKLLEDLEEKLHPRSPLTVHKDKKEKEAVEPRELFIVSVCAGMGGIGKTQLALQYMLHHKHPYTLKAWFLSENIDQLKQQYIEFAKTIGYREKEPAIETALPYVKNWLSKNPGWLLIYDNVNNYEAIKEFLPNNGGSIILTTRQRKWPNTFKILDIDVMKEEESIALIQSLINRDIAETEKKSVKELVDALGYLPLALAQAGAYIRQNSISFSDYLDLYKKNEQQLLADNTLPEGTDSLSVSVTWNISLEAIIKESQAINQPPLALHLLSVCAYLAPERIPQDLLLGWLKKNYSNLSSPELLLQKLISQLWQYSLIDRGDKDITVHRLIQAVVRHQHRQLSEKKDAPYEQLTLEWYNKFLKNVHVEFHRKTQALEDETRKELLFPHLQNLAKNYQQLWPEKSSEGFGEILLDIASVFLYHRGDPLSAKLYYERALKILENYYGKDHVQIAMALTNLGNTYGDLGDSSRQKELLEQALVILERHYGKEHVQMAITLTNLANAYGDLGNYKQQKKLLERALVIFEREYGKDHMQIAITLTNLGNACGDLGDSRRQKELLEHALAIFEREYGKDHVQVASALVSLGSAYGDLGDFQKKKELLERALHIEERYYGKEHREVATTLVSFGNAYGALGDYKQQKESLERALTIFEREYGKDHVQVAMTLTNLGNSYGDLGDYRQQKLLLERALAIEQSYYGKDHIEVAIVLTNLGNSYGALGDAKKQKELLERALAIKENYYGKEHPQIAITLVNLGNAYGALGNAIQQEELQERALVIFENNYGKDHIQVGITLANLGNAYGILGNPKRQKELLERALSIEERYYGKEHVQVSIVLTNLGSAYGILGGAKKQKELLERALAIKENFYGKEHVQTAITLTNLGNAYGALGDFKQQKKFLECALAIFEREYGKEHINVVPTLFNLSIAHLNLNKFSTAQLLSKQCHQVYYKNYGVEHYDTQNALNLVKNIEKYSAKTSFFSQARLSLIKPSKNDQMQADYQIPHGKDRMQTGLYFLQEEAL